MEFLGARDNMANDYTYKLGLNDSIVSGLQRKAQIEQAARAEAKQQEQAAWTQVAQQTSIAVSNNIAYTKEKQKRDFIKTLADSMASSQSISNPTTALVGNKPVSVASFDPQKNDMMRAAVELDPGSFTKQYAEAAFEKPKPVTRSLQAKSVLVDGVPTEASFDPATNGWYDQTGTPITGKITPISQQVAGEITDADRKRLTPLAKAVIEGRASPSALVNARGPEKEKLAIIASELDPNFDLSVGPQRIATRKDFSSGGKSGQALTSLNTVIGHLDTLAENGKALNNSDLQIWNKTKNTAKRQTGSAAVDKMLAARDAVTSELAKVFQGSGVVTESERTEFRRRMSEASSPEQIREVSETWIDLMKSRTDALKSNWDQSMGGVEPPVPFVNAKSKKILEKHGYDPKTLEKREKQTASNIDINALGQALGLPRKK